MWYSIPCMDAQPSWMRTARPAVLPEREGRLLATITWWVGRLPGRVVALLRVLRLLVVGSGWRIVVSVLSGLVPLVLLWWVGVGLRLLVRRKACRRGLVGGRGSVGLSVARIRRWNHGLTCIGSGGWHSIPCGRNTRCLRIPRVLRLGLRGGLDLPPVDALGLEIFGDAFSSFLGFFSVKLELRATLIPVDSESTGSQHTADGDQ